MMISMIHTNSNFSPNELLIEGLSLLELARVIVEILGRLFGAVLYETLDSVRRILLSEVGGIVRKLNVGDVL